MNVDIRLLIGAMFSIIGAILTVYGVITLSDPDVYDRSLGININLWWGLALLAFGVIMFYFGWRGASRPPAPAEVQPGPPRGH